MTDRTEIFSEVSFDDQTCWRKPLCIPVAVWWTHDPRKLEFAWAAALASRPGASFPVPGVRGGRQ